MITPGMSPDKKPARRRYENQNPVVSVRISREKAQQFDEIAEGMEVSKKEWLEGKIEGSKQDMEKVREKAYDKGFEEAKEKFMVTVPCAKCGDPMYLRNVGEDEGIRGRVFELLEGLSGGWTSRPADSKFNWSYTCRNCNNDPVSEVETLEPPE